MWFNLLNQLRSPVVGTRRAGDIIIKIGEVPIDENHSFINALSEIDLRFEYEPNQQITIEFVRENQLMTLNVTLGEMSFPPVNFKRR